MDLLGLGLKLPPLTPTLPLHHLVDFMGSPVTTTRAKVRVANQCVVNGKPLLFSCAREKS